MDKNNNNIFINYYVDWRTTYWLKDLFDQNGLEFDEVTELYNSLGESNKQVTPERAPSLTNNQSGI